MMAGGSWAVGQLKNDFPDMVAKTAVAAVPVDRRRPDQDHGDARRLDAHRRLQVEGQAAGGADFIKWLLAGDPAIMADFFKTSGYSKYTVRTSVDDGARQHSGRQRRPVHEDHL